LSVLLLCRFFRHGAFLRLLGLRDLLSISISQFESPLSNHHFPPLEAFVTVKVFLGAVATADCVAMGSREMSLERKHSSDLLVAPFMFLPLVPFRLRRSRNSSGSLPTPPGTHDHPLAYISFLLVYERAVPKESGLAFFQRDRL